MIANNLNNGSFLVCNFGDKFYIKFEGALRAAYLESIEITPEQERTPKVYTFRVAGLGIRRFKDAFWVYGSVDAYKNGKGDLLNSKFTNDKTHLTTKVCLFQIFKDELGGRCKVKNSDNPNWLKVTHYKWDGTHAVEEYVDIKSVTITKDGYSVDFIDGPEFYPSKEDCARANQISVIEFD